MKKIWVLLVRTSLPDKCYIPKDLVPTFSAFESFIDARNAMRETIKNFAFSKNSMFDGNGRIILLDQYIDKMRDYDPQIYEDALEEALTKEILTKIHNTLSIIFKGENTALQLDKSMYTDDVLEFIYDGSSLKSRGCGTYRFDGYDPNIATNAFSMEEEKDYYIYIDDMLGGQGEDDASSELYIDLKQIDLQ